jgi:hypothetical protein
MRRKTDLSCLKVSEMGLDYFYVILKHGNGCKYKNGGCQASAKGSVSDNI